jgi:YesN/AraC family two-component response regulator
MPPRKTPQMMWVDLTVSVKQSELPRQFADNFHITRPHAGSSLEAEIVRQLPDLLLFDFDYPERPGLKLLEVTKAQFPSIPLLMMTVQHSESLAVWAFRSRAWDFLVKPVSDRELQRCVSGLKELIARIRNRTRARDMHRQTSPVPLENRTASRSNTPAELMPALSYIEKNFRETVTGARVAAECSMDSFCFSRAFKSAFGITFKEYLLRFRIKEACRLLEKPDIAVTEVAYLSGFNDPSYFSKVFKRYVGLSPSAFAASGDRRSILDDERLSLNLEKH